MNTLWIPKTMSSAVGGTSAAIASRVYPRYQYRHGVNYDVAVIGAGVVGCTAAYLLKAAGKRVALIEGRTIGIGATANSTAEITSLQGQVYSLIAQKHDRKTARLYYEMNQEAVNFVKTLVREQKIDCDLEERSHILWTSNPAGHSVIRNEYDLCQRLDIDSQLRDSQSLIQELSESLHPQLGLEFPNQAQFNPYKYCSALCKMIATNAGETFIYCDKRS
jgi:glycine/D-amino acid oxidase-like deaminating enzyme